jgi:hypothetical protein
MDGKINYLDTDDEIRRKPRSPSQTLPEGEGLKIARFNISARFNRKKLSKQKFRMPGSKSPLFWRGFGGGFRLLFIPKPVP